MKCKKSSSSNYPLRPGPRQNEDMSQQGQARLLAPSAPVKAKNTARDTLPPAQRRQSSSGVHALQRSLWTGQRTKKRSISGSEYYNHTT